MKLRFKLYGRPVALSRLASRKLSKAAICSCAALLLCALVPPATRAQTFTSLLSFNGTDGANPFFSVLAQGTDGNLYGTTSARGSHGKGTVFKITPSGTLTTLYSFCAKSKCTDGSVPYGGLVLGTDGNFYGTTFSGGTLGVGTVYKITPAGKLTTLHSFNFSDGYNPYDALIQATDGNFYGTTQFGGAHLLGNVFKMTPQGVVTNLHSFNSSDGSEPEAGVIQGSDGNFYGTTYNGGSSGSYGTVFKMTPEGVLTTLHFFSDETDGRAIVSGLVEASDGNFYGTASLGGPLGYGTIYTITPAGALTVLHNFDTTDGSSPNLLLLGTDGNFYGTTISSGANGDGTVFEITPQGALTTLHNFDKTDGDLPFAGPAQGTNGNLYGVTQFGGSKSDGTVFQLGVGLGPFVKTVPASGKAGASVTILGNKLTGATSVSFNGTPATFKIVSATEITTTVPAGATTGTVQVNTPGGTLFSNLVFQVIQ
ncbi:MAG TPA: choice-of-anchor tandem repeat GloVer-containing protein [Terriglobia bacterium]|nr:choice-of-anchor tandem repeat GloVer-containing protein [Terriglobia bacterium]